MATEEFKIRFTEAGVKEVIRGFNDTIKASETAQEAIDKINRELNATTRYASRAQRSYENYARATNAVDKAQRAGIISAGEAAARQRSLGISYQSQVRPIQTLISKIDSETTAWKTNKTERIATLRTIQQVVGLQRIGINATEAEIAAIQKANQAYSQQRQTIADNAQARRNAERIINNAGTAQEQAASRLDRYAMQLQDARRRGVISAQQEADAVGRLTRQYAEQFDPLVKSERLQRERLNYQRGLFQSGSNLAQVERELTRMQQRGAAVDAARANSLRRTAREADRLQRAYQGITSAGGVVNRVLGGIGLAFAASKLTRDLDAVTTINNRLALVSSSASNANRLFSETAQLALDTRSDLTATVEGFSRIARSTKQIGLSQRAALDLTKAVNQSLKISGASAQEAAATVVQFGQALASNRLGGDELRSVLEQAPRLSQAVVDGINLLNKTDPTQLPKKLQEAMKKSGDINIGVLRDMAKQGLLTTKVVSAAVLTQSDVLEREFQKTIPTIGESFTNLNTKWLMFLNDFNKASGIASGIAKTIKFVGDNLSTVISIALVLGGIIATVFVVNQVKAFIDIIRSLPAIFGLATAGVDRNRVALDAETAALARNSLAQRGNGVARGVGAAGGAAAGAGRVVQGGGAAVTAVAAGLGTATPKVGALTGALRVMGAVATSAFTIVASVIAGLAVGIIAAGGAMLYLKNRTREASDELLIYGEGTTQKAIRGQISYRDVAVGVFNTLIGKTDEISASQLEASRQVKEAKISDEKEASAEQIAAMQAKDDATARHTARTLSVYENMNEGIGKDAATLAGDLVGVATLISGAFIAGFKSIGLVGERMLGNLSDDFASFYNKTIVPMMNAAQKVGVGNGATELKVAGRARRDFDYSAGMTDLGRGIWEDAYTARRATQEMTARAISSAAARRNGAGRGALDGPGTNTVTDPVGKDKNGGANEAKKLASAYRQLRDELDPLAKVTEDYEKDQLTLNNALKSGLLTQAYHTELMGRLTKRYNEARDPIGKMIADQQRENEILLLNVDAREAASLALQRQMQLERQFGRELTPEEKARVTKSANDDTELTRITAMKDAVAEANRVRDIETAGLGRNALLLQAEADARATIGDALRQNLPGAKEAYETQVQLNLAFAQQKQLADQVEATFTRLTSSTLTYAQEVVALNTLLEQGRITTARYERELRTLASAQLGDNLDLSSGVARGIYSIKQQSEDLASGIQKTFEDAYQKIGDGFVSIFTGDEFNVEDLFKSITANLARTLFNGVMDPVVNSLGAKMQMTGFGGGVQDTAGQTAAANTVQATWQAAATNMQMSWQSALTAMGTASNTFALNQQTLTGQVVATQTAGVTQAVSATVAGETTKNGVVTAGAAVTATAETAKTGAVVAGTATRTGAEVAAAATSKTLTIGDALMTIGANAVKAATGAYAAISSIPVVGPFLAPAVAAGALAAVFGLGKTLFSAEQGVGSVANDGDLYSLHKKEMVLPAQYATPLRDMLTTPGGREVSDGAGRPQDVSVPDVNVDANTTVNNVLDPQMALDAINTTAGTRTILNVIQSNPAQVRRALGV